MLSKLYTITHKEEEFFSIQLADKNHKIFKAHFPNNPMLPGFIMLEICAKILGHEICEIKKAKFINQAKPEDTLSFFIKQKNHSVHVEIKKEEIKIASLTYEKI